MKNSPWLVIVSGPAATGKTTLARRISAELGVPSFHKDQFKEPMYDWMGARDLAMHRKMGAVAHAALSSICTELVAKGVSHVLEANFNSAIFSPFPVELRARHPFRLLELSLKCEGEVLASRFVEREMAGRTHPGQQGLVHLDEYVDSLRVGMLPPLAVEGELRVVDTTDFSRLDLDGIVEWVEARVRT